MLQGADYLGDGHFAEDAATRGGTVRDAVIGKGLGISTLPIWLASFECPLPQCGWTHGKGFPGFFQADRGKIYLPSSLINRVKSISPTVASF